MANVAEVVQSLNNTVLEVDFEIDEEALKVTSDILKKITEVNSPNVSIHCENIGHTINSPFV